MTTSIETRWGLCMLGQRSPEKMGSYPPTGLGLRDVCRWYTQSCSNFAARLLEEKMADENSDTELIRRANSGDKAAFGELLALETDPLKTFCRNRLGSFNAMAREKTDEITQSAIKSTIKNWRQGQFTLRSRAELGAFLQRVVAFKLGTMKRKEVRRKEIHAPAAIEGAEAQTTSTESAEHRKVVVNRVIQELDPLERDIVTLFYYDGCDLQDIPSRLFPKYEKKVSRHKIDRTREKFQRRLERADSAFRPR